MIQKLPLFARPPLHILTLNYLPVAEKVNSHLLGHWVRGDVCNGIGNTGNFISFLVWNFDCKFILNRHNNFYNIEAIQPQVFHKISLWCHLRGIHLVKILDDGHDSVCNLDRIQENLQRGEL
jgi:hypothetical protein